ncbi:MAG: HD domain-containing protein [archaeon]
MNKTVNTLVLKWLKSSERTREQLARNKIARTRAGGLKRSTAFLHDFSHGFEHGWATRKTALELAKNLPENFKAKMKKKNFLIEGKKVSLWQLFLIEIELSAIMHDYGRLNKEGKMSNKIAMIHHEESARILKKFLSKLGLRNESRNSSRERMTKAILSHDYHSKEHTPNMPEPKTVMQKLIVDADRLNGVLPYAMDRTHDYNKKLDKEFFNQKTSFKDRLNWQPSRGMEQDALTVMLHQTFNWTKPDRYYLEASKKMAKETIPKTKKRMIELIEQEISDKKIKAQAMQVVKDFENHFSKK